MRIFKVKPVINKNNGQMTICLPKKKLPKEITDTPNIARILKIRLESWE